MSFSSGSWLSVVWGPWDKDFPHCVPRTRERRSREPVKMLFHFHVGWASVRGGVPSDVPRPPAVQARPEMRSCVRAYPRKQRRASARTVVPSHQAMARGAKRARVLQAGYPAPVRMGGNRVSALRTCVLEMREAGGAHQHQALASVGPVSSIRVSGAALSTSTTGYAVQSRSSFAE